MIESKSNMVIDFYCAEKSMVEYSGKMEPLATKGLGKIYEIFYRVVQFESQLYGLCHVPQNTFLPLDPWNQC